MGKQLVFFLVLFALASTSRGQAVQHSLGHGGAFVYKHRIIIYGYEQRREQLSFRCFSYNMALKPLDSVEFRLGKRQAEQYLDISRDTLHDVMNFYFQKADLKNLTSLCRLDSNLRVLASATDLDASHINSLTAFGEIHYRTKNSLYTITTAESDSGGDKQFYLSKYSLRAIDKPFEYDFNWQFPFDRKNIHRVSILLADASVVLLSVHVNDGPKKGQWLLRIDARKGMLVKAQKINPKGDNRHFLCGAVIADPRDKSISIAGSIFPESMIDFKNNQADFKNLAKSHALFLISTDSLGDIRVRAENALPIPVGKDHGTLHLKMRSFSKTGNTSFGIWADLYEEQAGGVMLYYSSWFLPLNIDDHILNIKPSAIYPVRKLVPDLIKSVSGRAFSNDGKLHWKGPSDYDRLLYEPANTTVVTYSKTDAKGLPVLLLKKVNSAGKQVSWHQVYTNEKGLVVSPVLLTVRGEYAELFPDKQRYVLFNGRTGLNQYQLSAGEW